VSHLASVTSLEEFRERKYRPKTDYLSYRQLSERLQRSVRSLQRDVRAGLPVALRFSASGRCLFVEEDVIEWYRRRTR
jgi:hypothetical protein